MNHADPLDRAQVEADHFLQNQIASRKIYRGKSSLYCHECGEPIPDARREAVPGCSLCVDCQEIEDKRNR